MVRAGRGRSCVFNGTRNNACTDGSRRLVSDITATTSLAVSPMRAAGMAESWSGSNVADLLVAQFVDGATNRRYEVYLYPPASRWSPAQISKGACYLGVVCQRVTCGACVDCQDARTGPRPR